MGLDEVQVSTSTVMRFLSKFLPGAKKGSPVATDAGITEAATPMLVVSDYEKFRKQGSEFLDVGKPDDAVLAFKSALQESPSAEAHLNLGYALLEANRLSEAKPHIEHAVRLNPNSFDAQFLLATMAANEADYDTAFDAIESAVKINPDAEVANNLLYRLFAVQRDFKKLEDRVVKRNEPNKTPEEIQVILADVFMGIPADGELRQDLLTRALQHLQRATALNPRNQYAFYKQGQILFDKNEAVKAIEPFENAIAIDSSYAIPHYGLAQAFKKLGKSDLATLSAEAAVLANPKYLDAHMLLAEISAEKFDYLQAVAHYKKIIEIEPDSPSAFSMLGSVYSDLKQDKLALEAAQHAVVLRKNSSLSYLALGNVLSSQGMFSKAVDAYRYALELQPGYIEVRKNLSTTLLAMGANEEASAILQALVKDAPEDYLCVQNLAYCRSFEVACTPGQYLTIAKHFGALALSRAKPFASWAQKPLIDRPLKVGLVSGDFKLHPVGMFLESVLTYLDAEKTEVHAFSNFTSTDVLQASLKLRVDNWTSIVGLTDEAAAKLIHDAQLDLLIDLAGNTSLNRCALFAWRPAPVQAAWLGYWASTGVAQIDYILADRQSVLPEHEHHFSEQVWYLANARMCYTPPSAIYEITPSPCPMVRRGHVTFGCFQSVRKLNKSVIALWGRIHQALPGARFRLQGAGFEDLRVGVDILQRFTDAGIPAECVSFHGAVPGIEYLKSLGEVDVILDTFPYPGGTTTCDALWMGVPTVTLAGNTMLSRQGASLLTYAGLSDWVAQTEEEYVAIAVQRAGDVHKLSGLRAAMRQQVFTSPLFNAPDFASSLEDTFREMVLHKRPKLGETQSAESFE